jgi:hypothetical protein
VLPAQLCEEISEGDHGDACMMLERQEMAISRDDEFGLCSDRTFKYAIVRFISEEVESGPRAQDGRYLTDGLSTNWGQVL